MRLRVDHATTYHFDPPMRGLVQSLRLKPNSFEGQQVIDWSVTIEGAERGAGFGDGAGDWIETATLMGCAPYRNKITMVRAAVRPAERSHEQVGAQQGGADMAVSVGGLRD